MYLFTKQQLQRLANIFDNAGQVLLGTSVLTPLIFGVEKENKIVVLFGIMITLLMWWISLRIERIASNL